MKIGVLSDTHLNGASQELRRIYDQYLVDMDFILHAGDYVSPEVIEFLDRGRFHGVRGNMDPLQIAQLVPEKKVIELGGHRIGLIHGWGPAEGLEFEVQKVFQDVDVIVFGHAHMPTNHVRNNILFFNPGAAIGYHRSSANTIGILDLGETIQGKIIEI
ncbi:MAG: metallophosphoesterase family protein [Deltaproteobacteria bacterium]|nr:metallophosphoesterase family protein [Deltaproteobacteria bacterium]